MNPGNMLSASQLRIIYFFQIFKEQLIGKSQYRNPKGLNMGSCSVAMNCDLYLRRDESRPTIHFLLTNLWLLLVEANGIEPLTPCLQSRCSPS